MRAVVPRWLLGTATVLMLAWALVDPRFRDAENALRPQVGLAFAMAAALGAVALTWAGHLRKSGLWLAVAIVGQAVTLQLIRAGPIVAYQHYVPLGQLPSGPNALLIGWLGLQTVLVMGGVARRWTPIRTWLGRSFRPWQLVAIGMLFALGSATLSRPMVNYATELVLATYIQLLALATILLAVWAIPEPALESGRLAGLGRLGLGQDTPEADRALVDRFVLVAAAFTLVVSLALALLSYQRHPHVPDEVAYLIQAHTFAAGKLWLPPPPVLGGFSVDLLYFGADKVYSIFPPGWPAILALGVLVRAPWIVNPVLAALNVVLAYVLLGRLYDRRTARMGAVLLACSPWSLFLAMSFMAHQFTLTCALIAALGVLVCRASGHARWAWLAGGAMGVISLVRPLDALAVALLLGLWSIGLGGKRLSIGAITGMIAAALGGGLVNLWYNRALTGVARVFPVMEYFDASYGPKTNALGFGPERGVGWSGLDPLPGHGVVDVIVNANFNIFATNIELFGWATGSLLLVLLVVFSKRMLRSDRLLLTSALAVIGIHSFYWFSGGPDFGARYWYLILVPCIGLTARGATLLSDLVVTRSAHQRVVLGVLTLSAIALVTFVPWRAIDKYHHYRGMRPGITALARHAGFGRSLVLIQGKRHPDYHSAAVYNSLDWEADGPVYAWERTPEVRDSILAHYADRPIWRVAGPSRTSGGYQVIQGPVRAEELEPIPPTP